MPEQENQNEINSQYDELKKVISDAANIKTDINSNYKETLKNMKKDFAQFMYDNIDEDFKRTAERLGLFNGFADIEDKKKREKKMESTLKSFFGKMFNKISDFEYLKKGGKPKETTPPKCDSYVMDLIANLYAGRLVPEVQRALDTAGIEINFRKPVTSLDLENNEDDRKTIIDYCQRGANIQNEIFEKNAEIEDVIFENIPDNMKYSETNPKGIKKAQFQSLADLQAKTDEMSMKGDGERAVDMVEKQCDKHHENSKNQEMLAVVTELILVGKEDAKAEPSEEAIEDALGGTEDEPNPEEESELEAYRETTEREVQEEMNELQERKNLDKLVSEDMD